MFAVSGSDQPADKYVNDATRIYSALMVDDQPVVRADCPTCAQSKDIGPEPQGYRDACESRSEGIWKADMRLMMEGLVSNDTLFTSKLPSGRRPVAARGVYAWKTNHIG